MTFPILITCDATAIELLPRPVVAGAATSTRVEDRMPQVPVPRFSIGFPFEDFFGDRGVATLSTMGGVGGEGVRGVGAAVLQDWGAPADVDAIWQCDFCTGQP